MCMCGARMNMPHGGPALILIKNVATSWMQLPERERKDDWVMQCSSIYDRIMLTIMSHYKLSFDSRTRFVSQLLALCT